MHGTLCCQDVIPCQFVVCVRMCQCPAGCVEFDSAAECLASARLIGSRITFQSPAPFTSSILGSPTTRSPSHRQDYKFGTAMTRDFRRRHFETTLGRLILTHCLRTLTRCPSRGFAVSLGARFVVARPAAPFQHRSDAMLLPACVPPTLARNPATEMERRRRPNRTESQWAEHLACRWPLPLAEADQQLVAAPQTHQPTRNPLAQG